ncbi:unnamed protein product [Victoria cruziana]
MDLDPSRSSGIFIGHSIFAPRDSCPMYKNSFWPFLPLIQPLKRERKKLPRLGLLGALTPPSSSCSFFCFALLHVSSIFSTFSSLPFPSLQDFQSGEHTGSCKEALSAFRVESTLGQAAK